MCHADRTYAELDLLFQNRVPAREFARTKIDPYSDAAEGVQDVPVGGKEIG